MQEAQHPALQLQQRPATANTSGRDVRTELQRKEHELSHLHMAALRTLEQQLSEAQAQYQQLQLQFDELKGDFQYNLQLLAERDAELEQADATAGSAAADLAAKVSTIAQLQSQLAQVQSDLRAECQRSADAASGYSHKCQQLQQQLAQERTSKAAALLEQQEQFQQQKHQLQALLAEAEDQLERQRRELSAGFLLQAQQIEAKHASAAADARVAAATAAALAEARAAEAAAAHEQAVERLKQAEAVQAQVQEAEVALKAIKAELQHTKEQAARQHAHLNEQLTETKQQLQHSVTEKQLQEVELQAHITSLQQQLLEQQDKAAAAAAKQATGHRQQLQDLQERLQAAVSRAAVQHAEDVETAGQLRARLQGTDSQLAVMRAERDALQERLAAAVTETITAAEAAADEAAQQIMGLQQDASRLQATNAALHQTLEEVHAAAASYKQQLGAAADKERELQRQLLQIQLMCEEQSQQLRAQQQAAKAAAAAAPVVAAAQTPPAGAAVDGIDSSRQAASDERLQELQSQRDAATTALAEAQARLRVREAELQQTRQALQHAEARAAAASVDPAAGGGGAAVTNRSSCVNKPPQLELGGPQHQQQQGHQAVQHQAAAAELSGSSWLEPDWHSALPSPALNKLLATPGSGASFWLDSGPPDASPALQANKFDPQPAAPAATGAGQHSEAAVGDAQTGPGRSNSPSMAVQTRFVRGSRHPLSLSADSGLVGLGAVGAARGAGVAALAAQLLNREAHNLSGISNSLEDVAGVMLGSPQASSRLQPASLQHQHERQQQQLGGQPRGQAEQQEVRDLAAALAAAEATNTRQRAVISALRQEMEELQAAGLVSSEELGDANQVEHTAAAAAAQVQLSVLRAELSASDAELQHVRDHLAIVLQQQVAGPAGRAGVAIGQQQPSPEVDFLRERVCTLLSDNRRLRRQAMQLQLQAAGEHAADQPQPAASANQPPRSAPEHSPSADQHQQLAVVVQDAADTAGLAGAGAEAGGAVADQPVATAAAAAELQEVQDALAAAEQHVVVLLDENERLMELSNGLRAENDGLKKVISLQTAGDNPGALTAPCPAAAVAAPEAVSRATALAWRALALTQQQQPPAGQPAALPALSLAMLTEPQLQQQQQQVQVQQGMSIGVGGWSPVRPSHGWQQSPQDWAARAWHLQQQQQQLMPVAAQQQWQQMQLAQQPPWLSTLQGGCLPVQHGISPGDKEPQQQQQQPTTADAPDHPHQAVQLEDAEAHHHQQHHQPGQAKTASQHQQQHPAGQPHELQVTSMQPGRPSRHTAVVTTAAAAGSMQRAKPNAPRPGTSTGGSGSRPVGLSGPGPPAAVAAGSSRPGVSEAAAGTSQQQQGVQRPRSSSAARKQGEAAGGAGSSKQLRVRNYNIADDEQAAALVGASPSAVAAARQSVLAQQALQTDSSS